MSELTPNKILMGNIDKLQSVVLIGITPDNKIHIETDKPTYDFVHYMLARATFTMNVMENQQTAAAAQKVLEAEVKEVMES